MSSMAAERPIRPGRRYVELEPDALEGPAPGVPALAVTEPLEALDRLTVAERPAGRTPVARPALQAVEGADVVGGAAEREGEHAPAGDAAAGRRSATDQGDGQAGALGVEAEGGGAAPRRRDDADAVPRAWWLCRRARP